MVFQERTDGILASSFLYAGSRLDNVARSSPFRAVFPKASNDEARGDGKDKTYSAVRQVGIRLRAQPFSEIPQLLVNAGFSFAPSLKEETEKYLLFAGRNSIDVNLSYYVSLNKNATSYYYFVLSGAVFLPGNLTDADHYPHNNDFAVYNGTASFFIVQRLGKFILTPGLSYSLAAKPRDPESGDKKRLTKRVQQVLGILGLQFQPSQNFNLNLSFNIPFQIETTNLISQFDRKSYTFVSLGGRFLF